MSRVLALEPPRDWWSDAPRGRLSREPNTPSICRWKGAVSGDVRRDSEAHEASQAHSENFDIDNQSDEYFTIVTPTSVATVKGTEFWLICNGPEGDKFFGIEGEVEIKNIESGRIVMLTEDTQVLSTSNGNILSQNMSTQELEQIENLEQENGDYDDSDIDTGFDDGSINQDSDTGNSNLSDSENIIRIQLEDSLGNTKEIINKYK